MARMFPNRIPPEVADDPRRAAERHVYERLAATLDDDYDVFGWVPWLDEGPRGGLAEGEADFLVAHEQQGFLVVEIKGGCVARDGRTGRWTSRDREGREHEIGNPAQQARRGMHTVLNRLKEMPGWEHRWIPSGYAIVLPDCQRPEADLSLDAPLAICAFKEDMANLGPCLRRVLRHWQASDEQQARLGADGLAVLESLVAGSFELRAPLGPVLREEDRAILELTAEQYRVLDGLAGNPRVLVTGGAGTGKTMLAMEQARRLARQGRRTLLTCFNRPLADFLRQSTGADGRLTIANFHQLCHLWARRAGLDCVDPDSPAAEELPEDYFQRELPRRFLDALDRMEERFDSIVVDEGQDFLPDYRDALELALADPTRATLHVFEDAGQDIYATGTGWTHGTVRFALQENLRNTRRIHRVLQGLAPDDRTVSKGPPGERPEWVAASAGEEPARLAEVVPRVLGRWCESAADLAVLVTSRADISRLAPGGRIGELEVTRDPLERSGRVLVESIPRFKGLERRVVVLAGLHETRHNALERLLYVGASRARLRLVVVADEATLARLRALEAD